MFQSTLPRGERQKDFTRSIGQPEFQSTLPRGERQMMEPRSSAPVLFQSTLPRGERRTFGYRGLCPSDSFNPRSREGSDPVLHRAVATGRVSIHAPARGATRGCRPGRLPVIAVSIHAPARGATGCQIQKRCHIVSIHAPARGATSPGLISNPMVNSFNPRSREGSDLKTLLQLSSFNPRLSSRFNQSTLPRGERRAYPPINTPLRSEFQSTLPRGERHSEVSHKEHG